jgi:hypothetical protein
VASSGMRSTGSKPSSSSTGSRPGKSSGLSRCRRARCGLLSCLRCQGQQQQQAARNNSSSSRLERCCGSSCWRAGCIGRRSCCDWLGLAVPCCRDKQLARCLQAAAGSRLGLETDSRVALKHVGLARGSALLGKRMWGSLVTVLVCDTTFCACWLGVCHALERTACA